MSGGLFMDEKPWSYFVFLVAGKPTFAKATAGTVGGKGNTEIIGK
jgi:hypothetical protein